MYPMLKALKVKKSNGWKFWFSALTDCLEEAFVYPVLFPHGSTCDNFGRRILGAGILECWEYLAVLLRY